jgi:MoxR-like ATPase
MKAWHAPSVCYIGASARFCIGVKRWQATNWFFARDFHHASRIHRGRAFIDRGSSAPAARQAHRAKPRRRKFKQEKTMRSSRVTQVLKLLIQVDRPAFVWGAPGVGKSAVVRALGADLGRPVIDIRAPLLDPTDLRGIPAVVDGRAVWAPPSFLPSEGDPPGILFFDELNAAPPLVQASLYQLVLDRRVGE